MSRRFGEPGLRAKDADRNRAVDLIDAAFSDGQLTAADRSLRSERALVAATLGDLEGLTRDLQDVPGRVVTTPPRSHRGLLAAIAAVVVLVVGGAVGAVVLTGGEDPVPPPVVEEVAPDPVPPLPEEEPEPEAEEDPEPEPEIERGPEYSLTPQGMRRFIKAWTEELGPPEALAFGFARHQVVIYRPSTEQGKVNRWFFRDGRFLDDGPETPTGAVGSVEVDLREVSVKRLFANLRDTKRSSGLRRFTSLCATILHENGRDVIFLVAGDGSTCWAMHTDFDGTVRERGIDCYGG